MASGGVDNFEVERFRHVTINMLSKVVADYLLFMNTSSFYSHMLQVITYSVVV